MVNKRLQQKIMKSKNEQLPLKGNLYEKNKRRISFSKTLKLLFLSSVSTLVIIIIIYGFINSSRTNAESITQESVISQLSKQIVLPDEVPSTFLRVSDAQTLASQDDFYKNTKNGDYIIVYSSLALVYDFSDDKIENIKTIK